jgi:hypothetical protein
MPLLFLAINKLKYDDATSLQNKTRQDKTRLTLKEQI